MSTFNFIYKNDGTRKSYNLTGAQSALVDKYVIKHSRDRYRGGENGTDWVFYGKSKTGYDRVIQFVEQLLKS